MAWEYGGDDPYLTHHGFGEDCRPLGIPEVEPAPPAYPDRAKTFKYACAMFADEREVQKLKALAGKGG